ncbi:hypothetical protein BDK51DRAFT_42942, partial [Blyttiomyces helicus]
LKRNYYYDHDLYASFSPRAKPHVWPRLFAEPEPGPTRAAAHRCPVLVRPRRCPERLRSARHVVPSLRGHVPAEHVGPASKLHYRVARRGAPAAHLPPAIESGLPAPNVVPPCGYNALRRPAATAASLPSVADVPSARGATVGPSAAMSSALVDEYHIAPLSFAAAAAPGPTDDAPAAADVSIPVRGLASRSPVAAVVANPDPAHSAVPLTAVLLPVPTAAVAVAISVPPTFRAPPAATIDAALVDDAAPVANAIPATPVADDAPIAAAIPSTPVSDAAPKAAVAPLAAADLPTSTAAAPITDYPTPMSPAHRAPATDGTSQESPAAVACLASTSPVATANPPAAATRQPSSDAETGRSPARRRPRLHARRPLHPRAAHRQPRTPGQRLLLRSAVAKCKKPTAVTSSASDSERKFSPSPTAETTLKIPSSAVSTMQAFVRVMRPRYDTLGNHPANPGNSHSLGDLRRRAARIPQASQEEDEEARGWRGGACGLMEMMRKKGE